MVSNDCKEKCRDFGMLVENIICMADCYEEPIEKFRKSMFYIIVSQEYHLYRALYIAKQLGIEAYGVNSDYHTYWGQSNREAREILARCKDFVKTIFKPEPTYLGETIPVSGDGNITND